MREGRRCFHGSGFLRYTGPMPPSLHAQAIRTAIDRNSSTELGEALLAARQHRDAGWQTETIGGYTCWSRVLANRKRSHLLNSLLMAGIDLASPIAFAGKQRWPLDVVVRQGNWPLLKSLLSGPGNLGPSEDMPGLLWALTKRWFSSSRNFKQNQALGSREERSRLEREHKEWDRREWCQAMRALRKRGYQPCCRMLSFWMLHLDGMLPEDERLDWVEVAWRQGVRPQGSLVYSCRPLSEGYRTTAAQVRPAVVFLLKTLTPEGVERAIPLVTQALAENPPTPGWMEALCSGWDGLLSGQYVNIYGFNTRSSAECHEYLWRFQKLQECLEQAWARHRWTLEDWGREEKDTWKQTVKSHVRGGWDLCVAPQTHWAIKHGLPASYVLVKHGKALLDGVFISAATHRVKAISDLFDGGLRLETPLDENGLTVEKWMIDHGVADLLEDPGVKRLCQYYRLEDALPPAHTKIKRSRF